MSGQAKLRRAACACGVVGPERGPKALAAGWQGRHDRSRKGPATWVCPACAQAQQLEAWRLADAKRERRFGVEAEDPLPGDGMLPAAPEQPPHPVLLLPLTGPGRRP